MSDSREELQTQVVLASEEFNRATKKLAEFDAKAPRVGELRRHPNGSRYAIWTGARWVVFSEWATSMGGVYQPNDTFSTWDGLTIEEWDKYSA